ncbi:hypothetical protein Ocin01_13817 [Orchesella cincta]|uniref:Uncharacterized protein n=1 Tax=Orchesella cincta TaxID=48709 RepID=A0A1D2MIM8_ORCCI|nr:hypothetical protein Ocin01_13817 [Orchesella cincta]
MSSEGEERIRQILINNNCERKNRDLNVAAVMPPIQEDVAAVMPPIQEDVAAGLPQILEDVRTRTPEGVLLALVEGAKVKINWTMCPRTTEAFMECSILNCNYSVPFGTTDDETNEAYKTMKEHIQQMHKKEADELAKADRVAKEKEKQKNFKCPNNPTCKHEVVHRTCALCGKKFGKSEISKNPLIMLSHKCQKSDKRSFTDGEDDGHHDDDGQGAPPNKKIKNTR